MDNPIKETPEQAGEARLTPLREKIKDVDKQLTGIEAQFGKIDFHPETLSPETADEICSLAVLYLETLDQAMTMGIFYYLKAKKLRRPIADKGI